MKIFRCDRHPDVDATSFFKIEQTELLDEAARAASLSQPGTRRYVREVRLDLCSKCAVEVQAMLDLAEEAAA